MELGAKIFVAGHRGLVGSAILRRLEADGYGPFVLRTHAELDLTRQAEVEAFFESERPAYVFLAAAKVGGILANDTYPAEFIYSNLAVQTNVIHASWRFGVRKLLFLGSSCIYPKFAPQPMKEEALLTGVLEPTNEPYAVAKIAGIRMCQAYNRQFGTDFISIMPTNLYGPGDNFDLKTSHVLPALIRKFHEARVAGSPEVVLWGTGSPTRELLHVDDLASASVFLMDRYSGSGIINVGTGRESPIREIAAMVRETAGFEGRIVWDSSKPDGTPRKVLDISRIKALGWEPSIPLENGIRMTYEWYLGHLAFRRGANE